MNNTNILNRLMNYKLWFFIFSMLIILPGIYGLIVYRLNLGVDFTGGTLLDYRLKESRDPNEIKTELSDFSVISVLPTESNTITIKTKPLEEKKISEIKDKLTEKFGEVEELRVESVGPTIGAQTSKNAFLAVGLASATIVLYLALAFRKIPKPASSWRFGIVAVLALLHDVLVVLGVFSLLGHFLGVEMDILFITALLTVIGFSVHDTIVVFDRIRENLTKHLSKNFTEVANISIAQTLARSLNTSLTVILVLFALLLFGGESIRWFIVTLLVGIISGTYSSIFNATALLCLWEEKLGH